MMVDATVLPTAHFFSVMILFMLFFNSILEHLFVAGAPFSGSYTGSKHALHVSIISILFTMLNFLITMHTSYITWISAEVCPWK
jgi:hypothetical protein